MASKAATINIPLNGELCLSKKQLDIEKFTGWDKVNGPIYGECLSPLYQSTDNTKHDYWNNNGDYYDIETDSGITLKKNGNTVFNTSSKGFKKEHIDSYWDSVDKDTLYACIRIEESNTFSYSVSSDYTDNASTTGTVNGKILRVKARTKGSNYLFAVLYTRTEADVERYYIRIVSSLGNLDEKEVAFGDIINPNIQAAFVGLSSDVPVITVYNNWGDSITTMETESYVYSNGWKTVNSLTHKPQTDIDKEFTYTVPKNVTVTANVETVETWKTSYEYGGPYQSYVTKTIADGSFFQYLSFTISELPEGFTKSGTKIYLHYKDNNGNYQKWQPGDLDNMYMGGGSKVYNWGGNDELGYFPIYKQNHGEGLYNSNKQNFFYTYATIVTEADKAPVTNYYPGGNSVKEGVGHMFDADSDYITLECIVGDDTEPTVYIIPSYGINYTYTSNGTGGTFNGKNEDSSQFYSTSSSTPGNFELATKATKKELPSIIKGVDGIMDDGYFYSTTGISALGANGSIQPGTVALRGVYYSNQGTGITYTIKDYVIFHYSINNSKDAEGVPKYYKGYAANLGQGYVRNCYSFTATTEENADNLYVMYDNTIGKMLFQPGTLAGTCINSQGSRVNKINGTQFNLLYNENSPSGISFSEQEEYIGTMISDWAKIDPMFSVYAYSDDDGQYCVFRDTDGDTWKISYIEETEWKWKVLENRFFIFNTGAYYNCYDMKTKRKYHYASDYNNRIMSGKILESGFVDTNAIAFYTSDNKDVILTGSGQNVNYEMNNNFPICSVTFPIHIYQYALTTNIIPISIKQPDSAYEQVDYYLSMGNESTVAVYFRSFSGDNKFRDSNLSSAYYPDDLTYNLNLFSDIIETYTNTDMVLSDDTAYTLRYSGVTPIFASSFASGLDGIKNAFVLQTMHYGISDQYLIALEYNDSSTISRTETITDISGLQYLGCLPKQALFYSPMNRSIYSFTGDAIMKELVQANKINSISKTWYNPSTQALYLQSDKGLYIVTDDFIFCLEDMLHTENVYFLNEGVAKAIVMYTELEEDQEVQKYKTVTLSYNVPDSDAYSVIPLNLETKYYGLGSNIKCSITGWYIRFYNNEDNAAEGTIKLMTRTITDVGAVTDEVTIDVDETKWDTLTNSFYYKYSPKYSSSVGTQLCIKSPFPIISIDCSYVSEDSPALSHNNG